jgi:hypothetical protein
MGIRGTGNLFPDVTLPMGFSRSDRRLMLVLAKPFLIHCYFLATMPIAISATFLVFPAGL